MSLQEQLDIVRAEELSRTSPADAEIARKALRLIVETGAVSRSIGVGDIAPDFELPDVDGRPVSLRELRRRGPVILDFFRGGWCPFCSLELRAYQSLVDDIEGAGATLVAISPETPYFLRQTIEENDVRFPVLSDPDNATAREYGIVYRLPSALQKIYAAFEIDLPARLDSDVIELPVPATYLVDTDGTIRRAYLDVDPTRRGEPTEFLQALRELRARS